MSKSKKIDLPIEKLIEIAKALNKNTIANKGRIKEEKISTDKFIKNTFDINRKDYIETTKGTGIGYNRSTFLYDILEKVAEKEEKKSSNTIVTPIENKDVAQMLPSNYQETFLEKLQSNTKATPVKEHDNNKSVVLKTQVIEAVKTTIKMEYPEIEEMIQWYKNQKGNENIIDVPEIDLNNPMLKGEVINRSVKTYKIALDEFVEFCKEQKETQKDLIALALVEFVNKYRR
ncbi:hypothetical protein LGL55_18445 [Clostridium tagluense]|uniref:hypothetical protein n=1 Tax=Clostridium tagluense TaxID=360422 RepID=UPI001CF5645C|nr:hypothetical protein [Clostridium tagluense]MCB2313244.1 hypothetical protein [Clostridium tagluense]MCB2318005.1 hypothetical protein [Clostridium tagluense]MCB2322799.1 hypothetical protein [Clostridium tagluense]MCB2327789.1 hypothetical protein [Clostridium tagluense]MCB2332436.1 hypothetical protein [Clostridium tagluense]